MVILVPWKPVVFIWLLLSAMLWLGCVAELLMEGRNPFLPRSFHMGPAHHLNRPAHHHTYAHKPV